MPAPRSKHTDWADLLQEEIANRGTGFPKNAKSFDELVEQRKAAGLPYGKNRVHAWLKQLSRAGKVRVLEGLAPGVNGRLYRTIRYQIL